MERPEIHIVDGNPAYFYAASAISIDGLGASQNYIFKINPMPKHNIIVPGGNNGTVECDVTSAEQYDTVTVDVRPDEGYKLVPGSLKVNDEAVKMDENTFTMPAEEVTVTAEFRSADSGSVTGIMVIPSETSVYQGSTKRFDASLKGEGEFFKDVQWGLTGESQETSMSEEGILTVGKNETAETLEVTVKSLDNEAFKDTAVVKILEQPANLAIGLGDAAYSASSSFTNNKNVFTKPQYAFDGIMQFNNYNIWTPTNDKTVDPEPWLQVDFGKMTGVNTIKIYERDNNGNRLMGLTVQKHDGNDWVDVL